MGVHDAANTGRGWILNPAGAGLATETAPHMRPGDPVFLRKCGRAGTSVFYYMPDTGYVVEGRAAAQAGIWLASWPWNRMAGVRDARPTALTGCRVAKTIERPRASGEPFLPPGAS